MIEKRFKVLAGRHIDEAGQAYSKGEVVTTDKPLDLLYPTKFQALGHVPKEPTLPRTIAAPQETVIDPAPPVDTPPAETAVRQPIPSEEGPQVPSQDEFTEHPVAPKPKKKAKRKKKAARKPRKF